MAVAGFLTMGMQIYIEAWVRASNDTCDNGLELEILVLTHFGLVLILVAT